MNNDDGGLSNSEHNINVFTRLAESIKSEKDPYESMLLVARYSDQLIRSSMSEGFVKGVFVGLGLGLFAAIITILVAT